MPSAIAIRVSPVKQLAEVWRARVNAGSVDVITVITLVAEFALAIGSGGTIVARLHTFDFYCTDHGSGVVDSAKAAASVVAFFEIVPTNVYVPRTRATDRCPAETTRANSATAFGAVGTLAPDFSAVTYSHALTFKADIPVGAAIVGSAFDPDGQALAVTDDLAGRAAELLAVALAVAAGVIATD
jgi:hypothetical protein